MHSPELQNAGFQEKMLDFMSQILQESRNMRRELTLLREIVRESLSGKVALNEDSNGMFCLIFAVFRR